MKGTWALDGRMVKTVEALDINMEGGDWTQLSPYPHKAAGIGVTVVGNVLRTFGGWVGQSSSFKSRVLTFVLIG